MKIKIKVFALGLFLFGAFIACNRGETHWVEVEGAVQKGPFVVGSSISVSPLDSQADPLGETFNTQTNNELGEFDVRVDLASNLVLPVALQGDGFYYNEYTGSLSASPITLRAIGELERDKRAKLFVNTITHLMYNRSRGLIKEGKEFSQAIIQAEAELRTQLGIGPQGFSPDAVGTEMNLLGGNTLANTYLFLVSAVLSEQAQGSDSALQELLNSIQSDLGDNGVLATNIPIELSASEKRLNPNRAVILFQDRLKELQVQSEVPDLHQLVDTDEDDVLNDVDNCRYTANDEQEDSDQDGQGDACESEGIRGNLYENSEYACLVLSGSDAGVYCLEGNVRNKSIAAFKNTTAFKKTGNYGDVAFYNGLACYIDDQDNMQCESHDAPTLWPKVGCDSVTVPSPGIGVDFSPATTEEIAPPGLDVSAALIDLAVYNDELCALDAGGVVYCQSACNCKSVDNCNRDVHAPLAGHKPSKLWMAGEHTFCGLDETSGELQCRHASGGTAVDVGAPGQAIDDFAINEDVLCAVLKSDQSITCNKREDSFDSRVLERVPQGRFTQLVMRRYAFDGEAGSACALSVEGEVSCWRTLKPDGFNGSPRWAFPPYDRDFAAIFDGAGCGVQSNGALHCW